MPYGDRWRARRRLCHEVLNGRLTKKFEAITTNTHAVSCRVCWRRPRVSCGRWSCKPFPTPPSPEPSVYPSADPRSIPGAIILSITYGIDVESSGNPFLSAILEASHGLTAILVPGRFPADTIPIRVCHCSQTAPDQLMELWTVRHLPDRFPGSGFKALAREVCEKYELSIDGPMEYVKNAMKASPQRTLR